MTSSPENQHDSSSGRPRSTAQPIAPKRPRRPYVMWGFLLVLLAVGAYGGYYGYCRYKVGEQEHAMHQQASDLHQALMRRLDEGGGRIGSNEIKRAVIAMAGEAGVMHDPRRIQVVIKPMDRACMDTLPPTARMGLGLASKIPKSSADRDSKLTDDLWCVGFKGQFLARHGIAKRTFDVERRTWFKHVSE